MSLVTRVEIPQPKLGGKCWVLEQPGRYILEPGPGVLRTLAVTHAGSGSLIAFDGVPDERGRFPDLDVDEDDPRWWQRLGRPIYRACPVVMGSWMLDGGFMHGLTIFADGGGHGISCTASIVWMPYRRAG